MSCPIAGPTCADLGRATVLAAIAIVCSLSAAGSRANPAADVAPAPGVMIEEDVVRLVLAGRASAEIVAEIERRDVRFDTTDEMLAELETAGVPRAVIEAMVRRQRLLEAERAPAEPLTDPTDETAMPALPQLRVRLFDDGPGALSISQLEAGVKLPPSTEPRPIEDVAVFLVCRRAEHVPDHWRSRSPLGRDFDAMPRHRMLAFVAGAEIGRRRAELALPAALEAELLESSPHDLGLGVALRLDGRYHRVAGARLDGVDPTTTPELQARIETGRAGGIASIGVRWLSNEQAAASDDASGEP